MEGIKFLGSYGGKTKECFTTCIQVAQDILIDAGNIVKGYKYDFTEINHLFLTHSHLDHINDIPYLIDSIFDKRDKTFYIYGIEKTLSNIKNHIFCNEIWTDYTKIAINDRGEPVVTLVPLSYGQRFKIRDLSLIPIKNHHMEGSCGYIIDNGKNSILFSSDTYLCPSITEEINRNSNITAAIFEVSFPNGYESLAKVSCHLTPSILEKQLSNLKRKDINIYINHIKPSHKQEILQNIEKSIKLSQIGVTVIDDGDFIDYESGLHKNIDKFENSDENFARLMHIGTMLTAQTDKNRLFNMIVYAAREFTNADGGTLYIMDQEHKNLEFQIIQNETLQINKGLNSEDKPDWPLVPLYHENGDKNWEMVAAASALTGKVINIADVYNDKRYNFSGTKKFDQMTGYRSKSMLVIPMKNHEGEVIGVLQLINRQNNLGDIVPFSKDDENITKSLASQAALLMRNQLLIYDLEHMLISFLNSLATTLDEKSPFTGDHIRRMVEITMMLAKAIVSDNSGIYKDIYFNDEELQQIYLSALMHDIGKISTPDFLINKQTKLESIYDRINCIKLKIEILKRDIGKTYKKEYINSKYSDNKILDEITNFLEESNRGSEFFSDEKVERLKKIYDEIFVEIDGKLNKLIEQDEYEALSVRKGTLTDQERKKIMDHVIETQKILKRLSFPKKYSRIPEIAGAHHEKLNGKGYPNGLKGDEIPFEARILAIADIFEALTAPDRPYKTPKKLSEAMKILYFMAKDNELDYDMVKFFYEKKIYLEYAKKHLHPEQIDEVSLTW
ncbi:HD domain-containing phosphohydrolase [Hydrogenimonas thermophila]|uniref:HD domain-containing phosphohydrolase n=1 Tax=Hydrogenimonas thermophila TaxID=223786 RepID=UPI002936F391|nr:HD domain-containing phosphohydrolase [Hydrogenimonas thermophila]WOE69581.1 HD domain-containing phosphohydrolase [Hydrogenimonas thermophila]WOE72095.1 HD domain-containing phosphohydrolase [Hydrogenimonas thermophila]